MKPRLTFKRNERLKSEKIISQLFRKGGNSFACYPLRLVYAEIPPQIDPLSILAVGASSDIKKYPLSMSAVSNDFKSELNSNSINNAHSELNTHLMDELSPIEFALSVPKKAFKRAVDRNILRRRIREAYRLNKIDLYKFLKNSKLHAEKRFAFMVLYTAKEEMPYLEIERGIKKMIRKFKEELSKER